MLFRRFGVALLRSVVVCADWLWLRSSLLKQGSIVGVHASTASSSTSPHNSPVGQRQECCPEPVGQHCEIEENRVASCLHSSLLDCSYSSLFLGTGHRGNCLKLLQAPDVNPGPAFSLNSPSSHIYRRWCHLMNNRIV